MCFMRVDEVPRFIYFIFNRSRFPTGTSYIPLSSSGLVVRTGLSSMRLVLSGVPLLPFFGPLDLGRTPDVYVSAGVRPPSRDPSSRHVDLRR